MSSQSVDGIELSTNTTVGQYREMEQQENQEGIADFVYERFFGRYIDPLKHETAHGFAIMATCCLLIEALECFRNGWPETPHGKGADVFRAFFEPQPPKERFAPFKGKGPDFYRHVRCGILHQGETTGGWLINRKSGAKFLDGKAIHARTFQKETTKALKNYCDALKSASWNDPLWIAPIIANCQ